MPNTFSSPISLYVERSGFASPATVSSKQVTSLSYDLKNAVWLRH